MKKLLVVLAVLACLSCSSATETDFLFINNSSWTLLVQPTNGQDWDEFFISTSAIGNHHTVTIADDKIYFTYSHDTVVDVHEVSGQIIFTDQ